MFSTFFLCAYCRNLDRNGNGGRRRIRAETLRAQVRCLPPPSDSGSLLEGMVIGIRKYSGIARGVNVFSRYINRTDLFRP